jgi:hypothetical protein
MEFKHEDKGTGKIIFDSGLLTSLNIYYKKDEKSVYFDQK